MPDRLLLTAALFVGLLPGPAPAQSANGAAPPRAPADRLDGPPFVTAKAWAVADGVTGRLLWGAQEAEPRPMASTTTVMTAWMVLRLAEDDPRLLDEVVTFSERAARTPGTSAKLRSGERLPARE